MTRRFKAALAAALLLGATSAYAATIYMQGLSAAATLADANQFFVCQVGGGTGCSGATNALVRGSLSQLSTYIKTKILGAGIAEGQARATVGDSNASITASKYYVYINAALTAARTYTLPAASSLTGLLVFTDEQGRITASNTATLQRAGSDTIDGGTATVALGCAYGGFVLESDGVSNWHVVNSQTICAQAATSNNFLTGLGADGTFTRAQPAFSNLSGAATAAQLPNPGASSKGGVNSKTCTSGDFVSTIGTDATVTCTTPAGGGGSSVTSNYITGIILSTDSTTVIGMSAGAAADSTNAAMISPGAFTKSTAGAWAAGTAGNGMGNGLTIASGTWYFVCLANNGGTPDYWFDTSSACANKPSGISDTKKRVVGMFSTCTAVLCSGGASASIAPYAQHTIPGGVRTLWNYDASTDGKDASSQTVGTSSRTLFTVSVPTGFKVSALLNVTNGGNGNAIRVTDPAEPDLTVSTDASTSRTDQSPDAIFGSAAYTFTDLARGTNTSAQIGVRAGQTCTSCLSIWTRGWDWDRGLGGS